MVLAAFLVFVLFAGANAIGVRFVLREMGPFWSAAIRFAIAGLLLLLYMIATRRPVPRGQRLTGSVLFGIVGFGLAYTFLYQALKDAPAGTTMLMLAIVPLLTVLLATVQGIERLRLLALAGAALAAVGILIVGASQISLNVPIAALALLLGGSHVPGRVRDRRQAVPARRSGRRERDRHAAGAVMLAVVALVTGEALVVPSKPETWLAMAYLIGPGSVAVFVLVLYVLARWTASATSYAFLLFPLVAIGLGGLLLKEPIQPSFVVGGAIVLAGVYIGAVYRPKERAEAVTKVAAGRP